MMTICSRCHGAGYYPISVGSGTTHGLQRCTTDCLKAALAQDALGPCQSCGSRATRPMAVPLCADCVRGEYEGAVADADLADSAASDQLSAE